MKNPDDKHDFSIKRDVKFLSDQGIAEQSFYQNQNLHYCWCTRHLTGSSGAFSALAQIESEIFMILDSTTWERRREEFYNRLKEEAINPNCPQKQIQGCYEFNNFSNQIIVSRYIPNFNIST